MIITNNMSAAGLTRQYDSTVNTGSRVNGDYRGSNENNTGVSVELSGDIRGYIPDLAGNTMTSQDSISKVQTINSSLDTMIEIMGRMNALSAKTLSAGINPAEREQIDSELSELKEQLRKVQNDARQAAAEDKETDIPKDADLNDPDSLKLLKSFYGNVQEVLAESIRKPVSDAAKGISSEDVTKSLGNILREAGNAMIAQSNQTNQGVLSLLY